MNIKSKRLYWQDLLRFVKEIAEQNPLLQVILTGDLNTRDKRFGISHHENHNYLDEALLSLDVISNIKVPTREGNTLDIAFANHQAKEKILDHLIQV